MRTIDQNTSAVGDSAYFGENGDWLIACTVNRDSDCLGRSNFRCFEKRLRNLPAVKDWTGDDSPIQVERFNHWACGWIDYLIVNPACVAAVELANELKASLEDYPVIDENDWSELEMEEANEVWQSCYSPKERVEYIRNHRSQFEFQSMADLMGCVRGKYFAGYASDLLG